MQSWHLLQLEPSALRRSDDFVAPTHLSVNGAHLAATLHRLEQQSADGQACTQVSNRLAELISGVGDVRVDVDQRREQFTVQLSDKSGHFHSARALSDGTLRFLALAVLELDPDTTGVWCLEEPENGIHPARIPVILQLLGDIAMDVNQAQGPDNPMRQVIINTHSPSVVAEVPDDTLLITQTRERVKDGGSYRYTSFAALQGTWRSKPRGADSNDDAPMPAILMGRLLDYLNPFTRFHEASSGNTKPHKKRVIDRQDMQMLLPGIPNGDAPSDHQ
jgi:predicted ATPase